MTENKPFAESLKLNIQITRYVNQTDEPGSMYAEIPKGIARIQCCKWQIASARAMTGLRIMILLYGAGGEPGRGETPMRL